MNDRAVRPTGVLNCRIPCDSPREHRAGIRKLQSVSRASSRHQNRSLRRPCPSDEGLRHTSRLEAAQTDEMTKQEGESGLREFGIAAPCTMSSPSVIAEPTMQDASLSFRALARLTQLLRFSWRRVQARTTRTRRAAGPASPSPVLTGCQSSVVRKKASCRRDSLSSYCLKHALARTSWL